MSRQTVPLISHKTVSLSVHVKGETRGRLGKHNAALEDFDEAVRLNPQDAVALRKRGVAKGYLSDHAGALADFDEAIRLPT